MAIQVNSPNNRTYVFSGSVKITPQSPLYNEARNQIINTLREIKRSNGVVLVGDATGIDALVASEAARMGVPYSVMGTGQNPQQGNQEEFGQLTKGFNVPSANDTNNLSSYKRRDLEMVSQADVVIGIWNGSSTDTKDAFDAAVRSGKNAYLFNIEKGMVDTKSGDSFESGISLYDFWNKKSNQLIANNNAQNRVTSREYWEGVDDASGINSPKSAFQKANFAQPDRFETTISNLNEVFSIINDRFKDPFMVQEDVPETAFVGQMRRVAFDQKYDPAWNSIGGFTNPLNSTQQLKWQNGGSGTFRDMVDQLASEAQKSGGSFSYAVRTDNYGSYLETVFTTYSNNRFYQNIRYNAEEGVWMSNTGTSNERVHTSRFTKDQSGNVEYQDIGYSLFQTLSPSAKDKNFVNGFTLPNYDRAQTFVERSRRMILGASLSADLSVENLFDVYETHDTFISRAQEAGVRADTSFGNLEFLKGKANSFNPPSLIDVSRRTAGTSATTEKDSVRRWRDKAIGLISFNGEIPELEWRSKVLFGSEVPMTGTVLKTASVFDPLSFGEGMGYVVGSPKLIENMEIPITPDAPIRNRVDFKNMKPGFLEINTPLGVRDINRDLGTNFRSGQFFVHGIFNRGLNDTISSSAMAMTVFSPGWQGEYKSSAYSKNQAVPLDRRSALARATGAQLITMSPIKAHRFVDETIDIWRQNSDDTYNQMLDAAVKSGDYKTRAEAERAMYEDGKDGLVELVSSPDGKSQVPRFARESEWQYYSALAAADWRRGQLQVKDINAPVQSARVDILLEEVGKVYGINLSYERILKEDIKYADLPDGAKDLLRDYGIKGFSSAPTKGVKFKREVVFDTSDRVTRAQRVTANNSFNITELDIDVLESQQPEVAKLLKEMYGDSEEKRVQNYHAAKVGQTLDLRNRSSDEYVHFIKSGGAEIDMSDVNTVRELNKLITLIQEQTTNPLEIKTSEEDRVNNLRKGSGVGYGFNPGEGISPRYGAALVEELKKVYKTPLIAVHRGDGRSTVLDLNKLSGKESIIAQLSGMIRNGGSTNLSVPEYDDEEDPVSNVGRIKVSGIATRAASASIPAGVVIIHEDAAIRSIMNMPISEEKKNQMIADLKNGVPLEGIVRVQNFDRIAGFDNQAVYTYEQAIRLWPEAKKDIVTSSNPVRVSELVPVKGSKDMDGDNLQITFTSRRHSTADQHWTERQLGTPYGEGVLEQSVGGEMQDIKKKTLGMLDSSESGHGRNLRALLDPYSDENKSFFKKALTTASGAGKSLREKFYANILMGYAYTSGTIVMSGMAQSDADSGRDIFSENQRFSMMHLPTDWYQKSMDLKPLENQGILSILGIRSLARRNNDGNWINPKQWKGDLTPDSKLLSHADFSDALLKSFIETSSGENSKDVSMSDEYNSQIGKSSLSRELAYLLMDKNTSEETFAQLTSLLNNKDVSAAFDLIKKSSPDWISGKSPLARYAMNMVYASQTLRGDTPVGALDDEVFGVYMNLLSRGIKKGDNISNFALVEALKRAEGMDEYKDSAFVGVLRKLAITSEDRETAKETKPYSYEKLVEWAEGVGDDDNAVKRAIKATISAFKRFSDGGFTGIGGKFDFAGIVHKGEYVITKEKVNHIRAGGGDAVMKEIAKELGATAFMSGAGSYWGGGYVGYVNGGIIGGQPSNAAGNAVGGALSYAGNSLATGIFGMLGTPNLSNLSPALTAAYNPTAAATSLLGLNMSGGGMAFGTFGVPLSDNFSVDRLPKSAADGKYGVGGLVSDADLRQIAREIGYKGLSGKGTISQADYDLFKREVISVDKTVAGRGGDVTFRKGMTVGELVAETQKVLGSAKTGQTIQDQDHLKELARTSAGFADFDSISMQELYSREWDAEGSGLVSSYKLKGARGPTGAAYSKRRAQDFVATHGSKMNSLDWATGVMARMGNKIQSAEDFGAMDANEQLMVQEALGIIGEVRKQSETAFKGKGLEVNGGGVSPLMGLGTAHVVGGGGRGDRIQVLSGEEERLRSMGITGISQREAAQRGQKLQADFISEHQLDGRSLAQTAIGMNQLAKSFEDISKLLPKVVDGHKMYAKQAEESIALFKQAENQLSGLRQGAREGTLTPEQQKALDFFNKSGTMGNQSLAEYVDANKAKFSDLEVASMERAAKAALGQPYAELSSSERSDALTELLLGASSKSGKKRLKQAREMGINEGEDGEGGINLLGGLINLKGEGAQNAYGKFIRGFSAMNNASTIWAVRSISSMIVNPALESAAAYEKTAAGVGRSLYSEGMMDYDQLMGSQFGTMIRRQQRREAGQYAYGQAVYGAYAPLMDMFMSPQVAQSPLGLGAAIGVPAIGGGLIAQSILGKATGGMIAGLPAGALVAAALGTYGIASTMGQAATDVGAMAQGGFYGSLGSEGSLLKTQLANLGLAPDSSWYGAADIAAAAPTVLAAAEAYGSGTPLSQVMQTRTISAWERQQIEQSFNSNSTAGSLSWGVNRADVEPAIRGFIENGDRAGLEAYIGTAYSDRGRERLGQELGVGSDRESIAGALFANAPTLEQSGISGFDVTMQDAKNFISDLGIPWQTETISQNFALASAFTSRGLRSSSNPFYQNVIDTTRSMVAANVDPMKILQGLSSNMAPMDMKRSGTAFVGFADEFLRLAGEGVPVGAAISQAVSSQSLVESSTNAQRMYRSSISPYSAEEFSRMSMEISPEYAQQATTNVYGFEFNRSLMGGSTSNAASVYSAAVLGGDVRTQALMGYMPGFYGSAVRSAGLDSTNVQAAMENAWTRGASLYGKDYEGLATAASYYGMFNQQGETQANAESVLNTFTDQISKATDHMVDFNEAFQGWLDSTGQSFTSIEEGQKLFNEFIGQMGGYENLNLNKLQSYTGVAGGLTNQYSGISRLMGGQMPEFDFSSIRDRVLGGQMMSLAQSAAEAIYSAPGSAEVVSSMLSGTLSDMKAEPGNAMAFSRSAIQGMNAATMFDLSEAFGFDTKGFRQNASNRASVMTPAQYSIFKAAAGGDQMAQSIALSGTQFEGITPFDLSSGVALGRYETSFSAADFNTISKREDAFLGMGLDYFGGLGGAAGMMEQFKNTGIRGMQYASAMASYNAAAAQYGYSTLGRNINLAMTVGGAQIDPTTGFSIGGSNAGAERLFSRLGMDFMPGNGMTYWQIEDAQVQQQRERQQFQLAQQGQSIALSWDQFNLTGRQYGENEAMNYRRLGMSDRQFKESMSLRKEQFEYGVGYTQQEMTIGRGIQQTQEQWRGEDLAYNRNMMEVQFGFQMRDYNRNIRYARGRERLDMMRQRDDATVLYSMQAGQADRQETRHKTEMGWSADEFKRKEENFKKTTAYQRAEFALQEKQHKEQMKFSEDELKLQRKHFEESRELEKKRLEMQGEAHVKELEWLAESIEWDNQKRLLDRQGYLENIKIQQLSADAAMGAQTRIKDLNLAMMGLKEIATQNNAELKTMAYTNMPEYLDQLTKVGDRLGQIAGTLGKLLGMGDGAYTGGLMGDSGFVPQMADGGPTPPGLTMQSAGLVGLHAGEYVVPQKGTLAIRGDNPETISLLREIRDELVELRKMGPGRVNAQIYTNEKSLDTGMLVNAAYTTRKQ